MHSSHGGEDDRPRHFGNCCHYQRHAGGCRRAGLRESFNKDTGEICARDNRDPH